MKAINIFLIVIVVLALISLAAYGKFKVTGNVVSKQDIFEGTIDDIK